MEVLGGIKGLIDVYIIGIVPQEGHALPQMLYSGHSELRIKKGGWATLKGY